jgi:hypothetical protein
MVAEKKKGNPVLQPGQGIFVSISSGLPSSLMNTARRICLEIGLVPFVYKGLKQMSGRTTTSIHIEASKDLMNAGALFILFPLDIPSILDEWILGRIPYLLKNGTPIQVYIFGDRSADAPSNLIELRSQFPNIPIKQVFDLVVFETTLQCDLLGFLSGLGTVQ